MQKSLTAKQNETECRGEQANEKDNHHFFGCNAYDNMRFPG